MVQASISSRGFLPEHDPLRQLPAVFSPWEALAHDLPQLLVGGGVRPRVEALPELDASDLSGEPQWRRAMMLLSFIGHAYVWGEPVPARRVPAPLARPWYAVAERLGRPPVLSYASYALDNFRRLDPNGPVAVGNLGLLQHFLGGADEEWFITLHVDIEAKAARGLALLEPAQRAAREGNLGVLESSLVGMAEALEQMVASLSRMPQWCDPYIYYVRVRPFIFGWKDQPALPEGVIYEGVEAFGGAPRFFRGETGAQSSIVPAFDAALGVSHHPDPLRRYLCEMRDYMPPDHRRFIEAREAEPAIVGVVESHRNTRPALRDAFNDCIHYMQEFRSKHLEFAARYIYHQSQRSRTNPTDVGTGGTPFMGYLKKHRDETADHHVAENEDVEPA